MRGGVDLKENINRPALKSEYDSFYDTWWELVEEGLLKPATQMEVIVKNTRLCADSNLATKPKVIRLLSHLCAHWTLSETDSYNDAKATGGASADRSNYLKQPHAAQVVAILRLLGDLNVGWSGGGIMKPKTPSFSSSNHLVQIKTGEGKSVTLAMTAAVLALLGCDVKCVCFSEYLSQRDFMAFESLFTAFGVERHIRYGTFGYLCEELINQRGSIRTMAQSYAAGDAELQGRERLPNARPQVLMIDEVDVFFSKDFYGNVYRPLARLADPTITRLVRPVCKSSPTSAHCSTSILWRSLWSLLDSKRLSKSLFL
jgi:hypothetical protein